MIRKTILAFLVMLAVYSIGIMKIDPSLQVSQHQWQDNVIKAQNFIYNFNVDTAPNVIVGSSLASRLIMDSLHGYYNLSFSGQGILDGLNILDHSKKLPKNLFIETNVALKNEDKNFTGALFNPFLYYMRKYIPSLRDGKQPIAIAGKLVMDMKKKNKSAAEKTAFINDDSSYSKYRRSDLFTKLLNNEVNTYKKKPDTKLVDQSFSKLQNYISSLQKKGVNIIFFEMPVESRLCSLALATTIRSTFYRKFPPSKYAYIPQPDCSGYHTTDGIHLIEPDAIRYTNYFKDYTKMYIH